MLRFLILSVAVLFGAHAAVAEDEEQATPDAPTAAESIEAQETQEAQEPREPQGNGIDQPKTMSGMSILGNEEAPKSLVIIPWKSSEIGSDRDLANSLDDRAEPVDKDVFLRQLRYYEIRAGK